MVGAPEMMNQVLSSVVLILACFLVYQKSFDRDSHGTLTIAMFGVSVRGSVRNRVNIGGRPAPGHPAQALPGTVAAFAMAGDGGLHQRTRQREAGG
jgi:hypothetical protein